jgi:serine/threonine protein kinase
MGQIRLCEPGVCGSEPYIAPEVLSKQGPYDPRPMDVWGSAIIMIYLTFGGAIWERAAKGQPNYDALIKSWNKWNDKHPDANLDELQITESDYPVYMPFDSFVNPPGLRRVLLQMLHPIPSRRITMAEVLNQRWMKATECCQLESYEDPSKLIDASKKASMVGAKKYFCHNHLPPKEHKIGMTMPQYS